MASFIQGDYEYVTYSSTDNVSVGAVNRHKTTYNNIPSQVQHNGITYVVTDMNHCFTDCGNLVSPPEIPNTITNMNFAFENCSSLTTFPIIPPSVKEMQACFKGCWKVNGHVTIPQGVTDLYSCFEECKLLTTAPKIPSNVRGVTRLFYGCTSLIGDVFIMGDNITVYTYCFYDTINPITLYTYSSNANNIRNTANNSNITLAHINIVPLSSKTQNGGTRVDMLLDCTYGKYIANIGSNMTLYDMGDNPIQIGDSVEQPSLLRCYGVYNVGDILQVPTTNLIISIRTISPSYNAVTIGAPSTATPSAIKQQGESNPISPRIDVTNVRFNPETTNLPYNVGEIVGVNTTTMTKSQTNVDGDIKHIVAHADNVMIDANTSLQDWITEQYSYLT